MKHFTFIIVFFIAHLSVNAQQVEEVESDKIVIGTNQEPPVEGDPIFLSVQKMPEFSGGEAEMHKFISNNLKYPIHSRDNNKQGTVYLTFVVEKDGELSDIRLLRGVNEELNNEAKRVIKSMPKWNPGKQNGKPVRVQYNVPIKFILKNIEK